MGGMGKDSVPWWAKAKTVFKLPEVAVSARDKTMLRGIQMSLDFETIYWEPESLVAKLVVGARVRVRGFAECPFAAEAQRQDGIHAFCHWEELVGKEGTITTISESTNYSFGHRFKLQFVDFRGYGHYAAIELEIVEG